MSRAIALALCLLFSGIAGGAAADEPTPAAPVATKESKSFGHRLLFYIPNRVFDVLDLVRLRVRVGPGLSASVRATELADLTIGAHATVFAGLHGPRSQPEIPWPIGLETLATVEVSVAEAGSDEGRFGPQYGPLEVGAGFQAGIIGLDIGVEPYDAFDLVLGLLTLDPKGDDF